MVNSQDALLLGCPFQGMRSYLLGFLVVCAEKQSPRGGKTRGSGTKKRCSHKWWWRRLHSPPPQETQKWTVASISCEISGHFARDELSWLTQYSRIFMEKIVPLWSIGYNERA